MVEPAVAAELVSYISSCQGPKSISRAMCHVTANHNRQLLPFSKNL